MGGDAWGSTGAGSGRRWVVGLPWLVVTNAAWPVLALGLVALWHPSIAGPAGEGFAHGAGASTSSAIEPQIDDEAGQFALDTLGDVAMLPQGQVAPALSAWSLPSEVHLVLSEGVPPAAARDVADGIAMTATYLRRTLGVELEPFTVDVAVDPGALVDRMELYGLSSPGQRRSLVDGLKGRRAMMWGGHFFLLVDGQASVWQRRHLLASTAHEMVHVLAWQLAAADDDFVARLRTRDVPAWLVEGGAEYYEVQVMASFRETDLESERASRVGPARGLAASLEADHGEAADGLTSNADYTLGFLAMDYLMQSRDGSAFAVFWGLVGAVGWEEAFERAFGEAPASFYEGFASYRERWFPRYAGGVSGRVVDDEWTRYGGIYVWACLPRMGVCPFVARTGFDGLFVLPLPPGRYELRFGLDGDEDEALLYHGFSTLFPFGTVLDPIGRAGVVSVESADVAVDVRFPGELRPPTGPYDLD